MKRNDILLIAGILLAALLCTGIYFLKYHKTGDMVQISIDGTVSETLPLDSDTTYTIETADGSKNILKIADGQATITNADCPDKLCVHQKAISLVGENLVCLPHKVVVTIVNTSKKATLDGVAQQIPVLFSNMN